MLRTSRFSIPFLLPYLAAGVLSAGEVEVRPSAGMVRAARSLADSVSGDPGLVERLLAYRQADELLLDLDDESRRDWSYWPRPRAGLTLSQMDLEQRRLAQDLFASLLSARGYLQLMHIIQLERVLAGLDQIGLSREVGGYSLVIFGEPGSGQPWSWRLEGHHVSLNVTVAEEATSVTPSFLGSNPGEIRGGALAGFRPLRYEEELGRELLSSLDRAQRERAVISERAPSDIVTGTLFKDRSTWDDWRRELRPDGVRVGDLSAASRRIADALFDHVLATYRSEIAAPYDDRIERAEAHFAWMGGQERGEPHYYRLQCGDFVFEYDNVQDEANHVHTVWRDRSADFGADLLGAHYRAQAH